MLAQKYTEGVCFPAVAFAPFLPSDKADRWLPITTPLDQPRLLPPPICTCLCHQPASSGFPTQYHWRYHNYSALALKPWTLNDSLGRSLFVLTLHVPALSLLPVCSYLTLSVTNMPLSLFPGKPACLLSLTSDCLSLYLPAFWKLKTFYLQHVSHPIKIEVMRFFSEGDRSLQPCRSQNFDALT